MVTVREPILHPVPIEDLRPTQITVGMREVEEKRQRWREYKGDKKSEYLGKHMIPVIFGPKERHYVIDHHHLSRALLDEGVEHVLVTVVADLRALDRDAFWVVLDHRGWVHPYDDNGERRGFGAIPKSVGELLDDPFRSLAGELRRAGGFAKETTPFSEFLWADFLRRRIARKAVEKDFAKAMEKALALARSQEAHYLPGWCGPATNMP
jgi:hypothetical protein